MLHKPEVQTFLPNSVQTNVKVFEQQEPRCSSDMSLLRQAGSRVRGPLPSPAKSCLLPGQLSWLPSRGHEAQDGTVPELP